MHVLDDLEATAEQVRRRARDAGMSVFDGAPLLEPPLDNDPFRGVLSAEWPHDDWQSFLDTAKDVGVSLLYVVVHHLEHSDIKDLMLRYTEIEESFWHTMRAYVGETTVLVITWMHGGVAHRWMGQSGWHQGFNERFAFESDPMTLFSRYLPPSL